MRHPRPLTTPTMGVTCGIRGTSFHASGVIRKERRSTCGCPPVALTSREGYSGPTLQVGTKEEQEEEEGIENEEEYRKARAVHRRE